MLHAMRGILLAGGRGSRLGPASLVVNKHLQQVFDKPLIFYPLSTLMLAGIREIAVVTNPRDIPALKALLGSGDGYGLSLTYVAQESPLGVVDGLRQAEGMGSDQDIALILGDNVFHGPEFGRLLAANFSDRVATAFGVHVADPSQYAVIESDGAGRPIAIHEKPVAPPSNWAVPGLYFFPRDVWEVASEISMSRRGEYEIADLLGCYLERNRLMITKVSRASFWTDAGTPASLLAAANYVESITSRHGELVSSPEEIAFRQGWISADCLLTTAARLDGSDYGTRLRSLLDDV